MFQEVVEKKWGKEEWITNNDLYCAKYLHIKKGWRFSLQYHKKKDETFYVLKGLLFMEHNDKQKIIKTGDSERIYPLDKHRLSALKDSIILEISTKHDDSDTYRIEVGQEFDVKKFKSDLKKRGFF